MNQTPAGAAALQPKKKMIISEKKDIVYTSAEDVSCKGSTIFDGHPLVYYTFGEFGHLPGAPKIIKGQPEAICAYCGRKFIYKKDAERKTNYP